MKNKDNSRPLDCGVSHRRVAYTQGWKDAARRILELGKTDVGSKTEDDLAKFVDKIKNEFRID